MKKTLLFSTLLAGLVLAGCSKSTRSDTVTTDTTARPVDTETSAVANDLQRTANNVGNDMQRAANNAGNALERAGDRTAAAMSEMKNDISAKLTEWRLSANDIQADLAANRDIVRTKTNAGAPTGNVDKSTLQSMVEAKVKADPQLANLKLDINADGKDHIQIEGKASNADQVARAIALALDTDGVAKVTSKVRITDDAVKTR